VIRGSCEGGARLALPNHDSNLEDCFRLGRNYTLAVTETVRGSELQHLTSREYPAGDQNVNRNCSSPWYQARGYGSQPIPVRHGQRIAVRCLSVFKVSTCRPIAPRWVNQCRAIPADQTRHSEKADAERPERNQERQTLAVRGGIRSVPKMAGRRPAPPLPINDLQPCGAGLRPASYFCHGLFERYPN
jgi:hypothetical protein